MGGADRHPSGRSEAEVAWRRRADRHARRPRLPHLHQRNRRRAARGDAPPRLDPLQCREVRRHRSRGISAGAHGKRWRSSCPSPLSHAYEHSGGQFLPIGLGGQIYYAESLEKLAANIAEVRPTHHGRGAAPVRAAAHPRPQGDRAAGARCLADAGAGARGRARRREASGSWPFWDWPLRAVLDRAFIPKVRERFGGRLKALGLRRGAAQLRRRHVLLVAGSDACCKAMARPRPGPVISANRPAGGHADGDGRAAAQGMSR